MENILAALTVISALVLAATGLVKSSIPDNKYLPFINVAVGLAIGILYAITVVKGDIEIYAWAGVIAGLSAGGFYDIGANTKAIVNKNRSVKLINEGDGKQDNREDGE